MDRMSKIDMVGGVGRTLASLALLAATLVGCARGVTDPLQTPTTPSVGSNYDASLVSGGLTRTYHVHLPPAASAGKPLPLMLSLHGRLGDGLGQAQLSGFNAVADQAGFIVVYPDGYRRSWNDGRLATPANQDGVDDVAFLGAVLDAVEARNKVDTARVYVNGMSNGGFMTLTLGCQLAQRFAAIAVIAANFEEGLAARCAPSHALPALFIHGTDDPLVPAAGGSLNGATLLSTSETVARWAAITGCAPTPTLTSLPTIVNDGTSVTRSIYADCRGNTQVVFYNVAGAGHIWPDGPQYLPVAVIGKTSHNLDASAVIWQFCALYHL
jgi:polyhydroxybutyrate depolymerase